MMNELAREKGSGRGGPGSKSTTHSESFSVMHMDAWRKSVVCCFNEAFPPFCKNSVQVTFYFLSPSRIFRQNVHSEGNMANNKTNHQIKKQVYVQQRAFE